MAAVRFLALPSLTSEFAAASIKREYNFVAQELKEKPGLGWAA
jgi:hypothetical protein